MSLLVTAVENGGYATNTYLVHRMGSNDCVVIDPGMDFPLLLAKIRELSLSPSLILLTHGHGDHIAGVPALVSAYGAKVAAFEAERELLARPSWNLTIMVGLPCKIERLDRAFAHDEEFEALGETWRAILTPGHTAGSGCFLVGERLFSGDTLFNDSYGRADLPTGDGRALVASIRERLFTLPPETTVLPGHGPATAIGIERATNPILRPGEEWL